MEQQLNFPFMLAGKRTPVRHGAYTWLSPFDVKQIYYVGSGNEGIRWCAEILNIPDHPYGRMPFVAVGYHEDRGFYAIEVSDEGVAHSIFEGLIYFFGPALFLQDPIRSRLVQKALPSAYTVVPWQFHPWFYPEWAQ